MPRHEISRRHRSFIQTRKGWKTPTIEHVMMSAGATSMIISAPVCLFMLVAGSVTDGLPLSGSMWTFAGAVSIMGIAGVALFLAGLVVEHNRGDKAITTPRGWEGLPLSLVDSLAPLEQKRIQLGKSIAEGEEILEDLPEDSANRKHVELRIDRFRSEVSAVEIQIESIVDEARQKSESDKEMAELDEQAKRRLVAEAKADKWLD